MKKNIISKKKKLLRGNLKKMINHKIENNLN